MRKPSHLAVVAILTGCCLFNQVAFAIENEDETDGGRTGFVHGDDCEQLSRLSRHEIQAVTHSVHAESFDRFCYVHGIYSCSDFNAMLRGAGSLEQNDSFGCSFVPRTR